MKRAGTVEKPTTAEKPGTGPRPGWVTEIVQEARRQRVDAHAKLREEAASAHRLQVALDRQLSQFWGEVVTAASVAVVECRRAGGPEVRVHPSPAGPGVELRGVSLVAADLPNWSMRIQHHQVGESDPPRVRIMTETPRSRPEEVHDYVLAGDALAVEVGGEGMTPEALIKHAIRGWLGELAAADLNR